MMDQNRTGILLAGWLAGELTPDEQEELELALLSNPGLQERLRVLQGLKELSPGGVKPSEEQEMLEKGLSRLRAVMGQEAAVDTRDLLSAAAPETMAKEPAPIRRVRLFRWAAAAAVLGLLWIGGKKYWRPAAKPAAATAAVIAASKEITAKYGTRSYLELPDSSKLWLNAGTKVRYSEGFATGSRELTLEGEAYFDIRTDPSHPFVIHTGKVDVKVLGTSVNVKAYPGDATIETTLIRGKVQIDFPDDPAEHLVLQPSEKVVIPLHAKGVRAAVPAAATSAGAPAFIRQTVRPDSLYRTLIETSWVEDRLVFRNEPFAKVAEKLERWYNIRISFGNDRYQQVGLSGNFKDQSIGNVMDALKISLGFHYRIAGDRILIW